jgi:hypothetical protein
VLAKMTSNNTSFPVEHRDLQFPWKLHLLLESVEKEGQEHIISWLPKGNCFRVHDKQRFTDELMQTFFCTSKYNSFQRSLNIWGFLTVRKGPNKGNISNSFFKRGMPDLCQAMERIKMKGTGRQKKLSSPAIAAFGANRSTTVEYHVTPPLSSIGIQAAAPVAPPQSKHHQVVSPLEDILRIPTRAECLVQQHYYTSNPFQLPYNGMNNTGLFHGAAVSPSPPAGAAGQSVAFTDAVVQLIAAARTEDLQGMLQRLAQQRPAPTPS